MLKITKSKAGVSKVFQYHFKRVSRTFQGHLKGPSMSWFQMCPKRVVPKCLKVVPAALHRFFSGVYYSAQVTACNQYVAI